MKVGIITLHRAANYGAVLQAYALQTYLQDIGHEVEIIDYRTRVVEGVYLPSYFLYAKGLKNKVKQFIRIPIKVKYRRNFRSFLANKLKLSKSVNYHTIQSTLSNTYDIVITGSDQVWNPYITECDTRFLLDFVSENTKKVSYAASFGIDELNRESIDKFQCICELNKISVREKQGVYILNDSFNLKGEIVCDPTLLLDREEWKCFLRAPKSKEYVLLYMIEYNYDLLRTAMEMAENNGLELIFISDSIRSKSGITYKKNATPEEWVGLFYYATIVVTNSFHGTAFSINFNKKLLIGLSQAKNNRNSRILGLLEELSVDSQTSDGIVDLRHINDWTSINIGLGELRKRSYSFLREL